GSRPRPASVRSFSTVSASLRRTDRTNHQAGEQAANTLQPADSNQHSTTANAKVGGGLESLLLVTRRPYLSSHSRGRHEVTTTSAVPPPCRLALGDQVLGNLGLALQPSQAPLLVHAGPPLPRRPALAPDRDHT